MESLVGEQLDVVAKADKARPPVTFQSCSDMNRVNSQGNTITAPTTTAAGTANAQ